MMRVQGIVSAMLGVTGLLVVMTTSEPESNHIIIKPLGPKTCGHVCSHRVGCSGYLYSPLDFSCRLILRKTNPGQLSLEGTYYLKVCNDKQRFVAERNLTCLRNSKIFHTRRNILKCKRSQRKPSRRRKYSRLLILPNSKIFYQGRQLYLYNNSMVPYLHINIHNTAAVAYIFTKGKLIISVKFPCELFTAALDSTNTAIINSGKLIYGISVDEVNDLVFLSLFKSKQIQVMTTEGKNLRKITHTDGNPGQVVADPHKQVIYVTVYKRGISKYTYKGEPRGTIYKGNVVRPLFSSLDRNVLYYATYPRKSKPTIFKTFLSNLTSYGIPTKFKPLHDYFYIYLNKMYLMPEDTAKRNTLHVLSDSGKEIATINTGYGNDTCGLIMCAIP